MIPVLLLSTIISVLVLNGSFQVKKTQVITVNELAQATIYRESYDKSTAHKKEYSDPDKLADVELAPVDIVGQDGIEGTIKRLPGTTQCPGSSVQCINFLIQSSAENDNTMASDLHVHGIQIIKPD